MSCALTVISLVAAVAFLIFYYTYQKPRNDKLRYVRKFHQNLHVVVTGGSKGIGKSIAKEFAKLGAHVTIIARNVSDLESAKTEIEKARKRDTQVVRTIPLDLAKIADLDSDTSSGEQQHELLSIVLGNHSRCDILINCCGTSVAAHFEKLTQRQFRQMMDVNYFSAVNLTRALLPVMKATSARDKDSYLTSRVVLVSSMAGVLSYYGYSAYSASKFALVGLALALDMELKQYNIGVTVSFPPDTDTPGFEEENKLKPHITAAISRGGDVVHPDDVAKALIDDMALRSFYSTVGLTNLAVLTSVNTFMPVSSNVNLVVGCLFAMPLKLLGHYVVKSWYKLVADTTRDGKSEAKVSSERPKSQ